MICLRKCVFFYEKSGTQNHAWPELIAEQAEIYFLLGNTEMAEQFYRRYREMTGSAGDRDRNRMRDFARCLACNDKTTAVSYTHLSAGNAQDTSTTVPEETAATADRKLIKTVKKMCIRDR